MAETTPTLAVEIQLQCMKDFNILQQVQYDKETKCFVLACPDCDRRYVITPVEIVYVDKEKLEKTNVKLDTRSDQEISGEKLDEEITF